MENIKWFGHASFYFIDKNSGNRIYYVDPFQLSENLELEPGDIVFITHAHPDHFSPDDLDLILHDETTIVAPPDVLLQIERRESLKQGVVPNSTYEINGFKFSTIPAYNTDPEKLSYHPKEKNWVGYIFNLNGLKIYHAGDTDFTPEMNNLASENLDIALLPIGGKYTMDVDKAIEAANVIKAKITVPIHYKIPLGGNFLEAEEKFKTGVTASRVEILEELK